MKVPGVLFLADLGHDHRIWADIPARLGLDRGPGVIVAAGGAAGRAVDAALAGQAAGLVLFQPAPDYLPPEARTEVPFEEMLEAAAPWAALIDAAQESDPARRTDLVVSTWRNVYARHLAAADVERACEVIASHAEEVLAAVAEAAAAAAAGSPPAQPGPPWVDRTAAASTTLRSG